MKIKERGAEKDSEKPRGLEVIPRWKQKERTIKREHVVKSPLRLRGLGNFLFLFLLPCYLVSPAWPLNFRISAMGSAKAIMAASWAPVGPFSACPWVAWALTWDHHS